MSDPYDIMGQFYANFPSPIPTNPERESLIKDLQETLEGSTFLSKNRRSGMIQVVPFFSNEVIRELKQVLVRENLRHLIQKGDESSSSR